MISHVPESHSAFSHGDDKRSLRQLRSAYVGLVPRKIAIFVDSSTFFGREILQGILDYQKSRAPHWNLAFPEGYFDGVTLPPRFQHWEGDGMIVRTDNAEFVRENARRASSVLNIGDEHRFGFPTVYYDHQKVAQLAVEHFASQGICHMLFLGIRNCSASEIRAESFFEEARMHGLRPTLRLLAEPSDAETYDREQVNLERLLQKLPKPLGVFAFHDALALRVVEAVQKLKFLLPNEVAVLGADNETSLCESISPSLSSIATGGKHFGWEAARYFDGLFRGEETAHRLPTLVSPAKLVVRQSSDAGAVQDPQLLCAMKLIREKACQGLRVEDLVEATGLPRRTLERKFHQILKRSPHAEILRVQVETTQRLLAETSYTLDEIARRTGFRSVSHLCISLKRAIKKTPGEFRRDAAEAKQERPS